MRIASYALGLLGACLASACATHPGQPAAEARARAPSANPVEVGEIRPGSGYLKGYLNPGDYPDSLALLPAPPARGSAAQEADNATYRTLRALGPTARGTLATQDADLHFPQAAQVFSCALAVEVSQQATPHLNMLLRRTLTDAGLATYKAKNNYQRTRPFVAFEAASCTPGEEAKLSKDGSYPSGHSAVGWAWALVLAEVAPQRGDAVLQRGRAFGQSRAICGVHWQSDIDAGRVVGAATVARLHTNPVFNAQLLAARAEYEQALGQARPLARDCAAESAAMASSSALAP